MLAQTRLLYSRQPQRWSLICLTLCTKVDNLQQRTPPIWPVTGKLSAWISRASEEQIYSSYLLLTMFDISSKKGNASLFCWLKISNYDNNVHYDLLRKIVTDKRKDMERHLKVNLTSTLMHFCLLLCLLFLSLHYWQPSLFILPVSSL